MKTLRSILTALVVIAPFLAPAAGTNDATQPLFVFIGDSITEGGPTANPAYKPSEPVASPRFLAGKYYYIEALWEATRQRTIPFRIDKTGSQGSSISGPYKWMFWGYMGLLQGKSQAIKEKPAYIVMQDYRLLNTPADTEEYGVAMRQIVAEAKKAGVKLVWSTVAVEPGGIMWASVKNPEVLKPTNDAITNLCAQLEVPVIRLDLAWERYLAAFKERKPAKDWRLTSHGSYFDGVHPGKVGAFFQALVFARELGIPADQFDETAPALDVPKEQAAEIKKLVYSWTEPTVLPVPASR